MPSLATPGDLAKWLQVSIDQLDWLSDAKRQQGLTDIPILQHYRYAFAPKKSGPPRLIEIPKPKLMAIQRRILHEILDLVPCTMPRMASSQAGPVLALRKCMPVKASSSRSI